MSIIAVFYDGAVAANGYDVPIDPSSPHDVRHRASQVMSSK